MNETEWSQKFPGPIMLSTAWLSSEAAVVTLEKAAFQYKGGPSRWSTRFFRNKNHRAQQHRKILENHVATLVYDGIWWYMMVYDGIWWYMMVYDGICSYHDLWLPFFKDAKKNRRCWWQGQLLAVPLPQAQQSQFSKTFLWSSACQAEWLGSAVFRSQNHGPEEVDYWPLAMDGL